MGPIGGSRATGVPWGSGDAEAAAVALAVGRDRGVVATDGVPSRGSSPRRAK